MKQDKSFRLEIHSNVTSVCMPVSAHYFSFKSLHAYEQSRIQLCRIRSRNVQNICELADSF